LNSIEIGKANVDEKATYIYIYSPRFSAAQESIRWRMTLATKGSTKLSTLVAVSDAGAVAPIRWSVM